MRVWSLGWEDPLKEEMAIHSSTLAWKIPWTEEPGRLQSGGGKELDTTEWLHLHFSLSCTGEGNGNLLQHSCLENPMDGGAWSSQMALLVKNLLANTGDIRDGGLIPRSGRSPEGGNGNPLWFSWLENPLDREAYSISKSWTHLERLIIHTYTM